MSALDLRFQMPAVRLPDLSVHPESALSAMLRPNAALPALRQGAELGAGLSRNSSAAMAQALLQRLQPAAPSTAGRGAIAEQQAPAQPSSLAALYKSAAASLAAAGDPTQARALAQKAQDLERQATMAVARQYAAGNLAVADRMAAAIGMRVPATVRDSPDFFPALLQAHDGLGFQDQGALSRATAMLLQGHAPDRVTQALGAPPPAPQAADPQATSGGVPND